MEGFNPLWSFNIENTVSLYSILSYFVRLNSASLKSNPLVPV